MTLRANLANQPTLAALGMRWLVLIVITFGTVVSSIGLTSSHGLAVIAALHESVLSSPEDPHGHAHADQAVEFSVSDENASGVHPHHAMDHSHDIAHHLPLAWGTTSLLLARWALVVRPWIEMGQAYRLDRPPMG